MFKELISKLKLRKIKLEECNTHDKDIENNNIVNINVYEEDGFYKIEIPNYVSMSDYINMTNAGDNYAVLSNISNSVLWNSRMQKIEKGNYYVLSHNDRVYNILVNNENIIIDERIQKDYDDERNKDNITEERVVHFSLHTKEYRYTMFKHDKTGDTYYVKYGGLKGYDLGELELSEEDTFYEIKKYLIIYFMFKVLKIYLIYIG